MNEELVRFAPNELETTICFFEADEESRADAEPIEWAVVPIGIYSSRLSSMIPFLNFRLAGVSLNDEQWFLLKKIKRESLKDERLRLPASKMASFLFFEWRSKPILSNWPLVFKFYFTQKNRRILQKNRVAFSKRKAMDFQKRFQGKISTMPKEGMEQLISVTTQPIEKPPTSQSYSIHQSPSVNSLHSGNERFKEALDHSLHSSTI